MDTRRRIAEAPLEGGHVALDFVNTVGGLRDKPVNPKDEMIETYDDLITWCGRVGLLAGRDARLLLRAASRNGAEARRMTRRAHELRELVYAIFRSIADGDEPDAPLLVRLRDLEREALAEARLASDGKAMRWTWPAPRELGAPLWQVAHAAVDLLTRGPLSRIKVCANCRWLFLDQSRNHSRRWCSMAECGTQIKQRRFVERRRQSRRRGH